MRAQCSSGAKTALSTHERGRHRHAREPLALHDSRGHQALRAVLLHLGASRGSGDGGPVWKRGCGKSGGFAPQQQQPSDVGVGRFHVAGAGVGAERWRGADGAGYGEAWDEQKDKEQLQGSGASSAAPGAALIVRLSKSQSLWPARLQLRRDQGGGAVPSELRP